MPSIYQLKPAFQQLLRPAVRRLAASGVTPNQITYLALGLSLLLGSLLLLFPQARALYLLVPLWLLARMALNAVDGMLARDYDRATPFGAVLNELADPLSDAALYLPFALITGSPLVVLIVVLAILSELAGVLGLTVGGGRRFDGPMGKSDRAFAFGLLALVLTFWQPPSFALTLFFGLITLLLVLTLYNRVWAALGVRV